MADKSAANEPEQLSRIGYKSKTMNWKMLKWGELQSWMIVLHSDYTYGSYLICCSYKILIRAALFFDHLLSLLTVYISADFSSTLRSKGKEQTARDLMILRTYSLSDNNTQYTPNPVPTGSSATYYVLRSVIASIISELGKKKKKGEKFVAALMLNGKS